MASAASSNAAGHDPEQDVQALADGTSRLIAVARAVLASNRHVDLDGIQQQVGLLCAKALDLPPGRAAMAKMELRRVAAELSALDEAMRSEHAR